MKVISKKTIGLVVAYVLFCSLSLPSVFAYSDEIHADVKEVFKAAQEVMDSIGIHKVNQKKYTIESNWIEDEVFRSRGWIRKIDSQKFTRRYKILAEFKQQHDFVKIDIHSKIQDQPAGYVRKNSFRPAKPDYQEYLMEKEIFMKILMKVQDYKKSSLRK